jgi:hypothetical protein
MRTGFVSHPGSGRVRDVSAPDSERELKSLKISLKVPPSAPPKPLYLRDLEMEAGVGIGLCSRFSYEEDTGFPSERQELFAITRHYFSLLFQYFH